MKKIFSGLTAILCISMLVFGSCKSKKDSMSSYTPPVQQSVADTMIGTVWAVPVTYDIKQQVGKNMKQFNEELVKGYEIIEYATGGGDRKSVV